MKPYQKKITRIPNASRTNTKWTDEDRALMVSLHNEGMSNWDIAKQLNRSHGAIQQQLYLLRKETEKQVSAALTKKPWWKRLLGL